MRLLCTEKETEARSGIVLCGLVGPARSDWLASFPAEKRCVALRGVVPGRSSPREPCGPPCCSLGCDRRRREDKMVILDADLSPLTYLLSIFS